MSERRWQLSRAGILNVYQYGDETLNFHGGRLLLRGVNGSGKSTAMNMLLPFLLDTDTRRIDAAGEQSGVLRSWMLADRDEQQPVGYLWLEFRCGDRFTTIGCGIRANRSTDRVTTWWFVTDRRPGIDLALVENRTPLSVDALRGELGTHVVFASDRRGDYRMAVRDALFGGADIDAHIRLLHILRSPRVGDRIDVDLPQYLEDALPQLSDAALDDAAQPLEDLEEHRRNVEDLTITGTALQALEDTYRNYAIGELHGRAGHVRQLADAVTSARRAERAAAKASHAADEAQVAADRRLSELTGRVRTLGEEIDGLHQSEAYKAGSELADLREHVESLARQLAAAEDAVAEREGRLSRARDRVGAADTEAGRDLDALGTTLTDLADLGLRIGLTRRPPSPPDVPTEPTAEAAVNVPVGAVDPEPVRADLAHLQADIGQRQGDVAAVREALAAVERAERRLHLADAAARDADRAEQGAVAAFTSARTALSESVEQWRSELTTWVADLDAQMRDEGLASRDTNLVAQPDLVSVRDDVVETLRQWTDDVAAHHRDQLATTQARRDDEQVTVERLEQQVADLLARQLPEPPAGPWQREDRRPCLAEVVDFDPSMTAEDRAGLEAALDAAGLLGAEILAGGGLDLGDGELVAVAGSSVAQPLSRLLHPTIDDGHRHLIDETTVAGILASISTDPAHLDADASTSDVTVVTSGGGFRIGALRGQHTKTDAEHVGVTARRAALERQRALAIEQRDAAAAVLAATDDELARRREKLDEVDTIRRRLPLPTAVNAAATTAAVAEQSLTNARDAQRRCRDERAEADRNHAGAVDAAERTAANHGLPAEPGPLDDIDHALGDAKQTCRDVDGKLTVLARSVQAWRDAGQVADDAARDLRSGIATRDDLQGEHGPAAARLATLEDSVGLPFQEVQALIAECEQDKAAAEAGLVTADRERADAHRDAGVKAQKADEAARLTAAAGTRCRDALPALQATLAVPGLVVSALSADRSTPGSTEPAASTEDATDGPEPVSFPVVPATADGARELATVIMERVSPPPDAPVSADSVRMSLRQRRDALGAGWDAEDRQPDDELPLHIEVTGPLGTMTLADAVQRTETQRRTMASLLSTKQDQALRNLLQGLIAREVSAKLLAAQDLVALMNQRLDAVRTTHGIGVSLRWRRRDDLDAAHADMVRLLAKAPDLRTSDEDQALATLVADRIAEARAEDPEAGYRDLIASVLDYRQWYRMILVIHRAGHTEERLKRGTPLSEGEKKLVSYLPLFAAVAASCDALAEYDAAAPRFVLLDDAFSKVSEDNHAKLFGLLVDMDLDFVATSERLWGTHETVPELAITEVIRDAGLGVIVLEHSRWDGHDKTLTAAR